nr:DUF2163 domain-containing protein [Altericroceibacterium endophyticum]
MQELESVAHFWRLHRRDGVTLGFTSHDRDLYFDGVTHRAAPGMIPSAIRRSAALDGDSADMRGTISHDSISAQDLAEGRFDGATLIMGLVDWESLDRAVLYRGAMGEIAQENGQFSVSMLSAKQALTGGDVPHTSPLCRARFCGPGCSLSATRFTHEAEVASHDHDRSAVHLVQALEPSLLVGGALRWIDGPQAGLSANITAVDGTALLLDRALYPESTTGLRVLLREGCDHRAITCAERFANLVNFQGEPFLPGNDYLLRGPAAL